MKLLEYEAKRVLKQHGIPVPQGVLILPDLQKLPDNFPVVLKSQVPVGSRGKAGGITFADNIEQTKKAALKLLHTAIRGHTPQVILAEEKLLIDHEFYFAFTIDRTTQQVVLLAHRHGGIDIESDASNISRIPLSGIPDKAIIAQLTRIYELTTPQANHLEKLVYQLWHAFKQQDALLLEINPLVLTKSGKLVCADAKMELDDTAVFRHSDWHFKEPAHSSQFVVLNQKGTVACMANGAGLAMATVDAINSAGGEAANFFDIGGGTNTQGMTAAFAEIQKLPNIGSIVVNVFAGITRCDEVAQAIVAAKNTFPSLSPLFIRLAGTNELVGKQILSEHGIATLPSLRDCVSHALQEIDNV